MLNAANPLRKLTSLILNHLFYFMTFFWAKYIFYWISRCSIKRWSNVFCELSFQEGLVVLNGSLEKCSLGPGGLWAQEPVDNMIRLDVVFISTLYSYTFKAPLWSWWSLLSATMLKEPGEVHLWWLLFNQIKYAIKLRGKAESMERIVHFVTALCQADGN